MLSRFRCSGALNHIFSLAAELKRQSVTAVVLLTHCPARYHDELRAYQRLFPCFVESRPENILKLARHYRFDLLHLHDPSLVGTAQKLLQALKIPWGMTLHGGLSRPPDPFSLQGLSFLITPHPASTGVPAEMRQKTIFIPEGIDLERWRPAKKEGFRIAFVGEAEGFSSEGAEALLKAAGLAGLEVDLICPEPLPLLRGRYYGWPLNSAGVISGSQIVAGRFRSPLEGMAAECAVLILGQSYRGIFSPSSHPASPLFPDLSGDGAETPCYRSIFYDLAALLKDRPLLESLQQQGRKFIRENCDLRIVAERTCHLYRRTAGK